MEEVWENSTEPVPHINFCSQRFPKISHGMSETAANGCEAIPSSTDLRSLRSPEPRLLRSMTSLVGGFKSSICIDVSLHTYKYIYIHTYIACTSSFFVSLSLHQITRKSTFHQLWTNIPFIHVLRRRKSWKVWNPSGQAGRGAITLVVFWDGDRGKTHL